MTDKQIAELLTSDAEKGLAAAVKQYSGYVYKIVNGQLMQKNTEGEGWHNDSNGFRWTKHFDSYK